MADETRKVNTAVEDGETKPHLDEPDALEAATDGESGSSDGSGRTERPAPVENSWSAPILSLARKATETISSGVSYAAASRNPSQGSAVSSPTEKEPENGLEGKKLPSKRRLLLNADALNTVLTRLEKMHPGLTSVTSSSTYCKFSNSHLRGQATF